MLPQQVMVAHDLKPLLSLAFDRNGRLVCAGTLCCSAPAALAQHKTPLLAAAAQQAAEPALQTGKECLACL